MHLFSCPLLFELFLDLLFYDVTLVVQPNLSTIGDSTCLLASDSFVRFHCAIWCSHCTGMVFLCGASRQPSSLWNCISNILFKALTGHISTPHSSHSSPAASRDTSKWSKKPQWHAAFFFSSLLRIFYDFSLSPLFLTLWPGQVSEEERGWRQSDRAALSVLSGPTISRLTYTAQINWTFLNSPTFQIGHFVFFIALSFLCV